MKCAKCSAFIESSAKFCANCGREISSTTPTSQQSIKSSSQNSNYLVYISIGIVILIAVLVIAFTRGNSVGYLSNGDNVSSSSSGSNNSFTTTDSNLYPDPNETVAPDPESGVDISNLPPGNSGTNSYQYGYSEAQDFINSGALYRALFDQFGGTEESCKFVLDTFMAYHGGASTRQQYADFMLGCEVVVDAWY
jgi:hypothetical protein